MFEIFELTAREVGRPMVAWDGEGRKTDPVRTGVQALVGQIRVNEAREDRGVVRREHFEVVAGHDDGVDRTCDLAPPPVVPGQFGEDRLRLGDDHVDVVAGHFVALGYLGEMYPEVYEAKLLDTTEAEIERVEVLDADVASAEHLSCPIQPQPWQD